MRPLSFLRRLDPFAMTAVLLPLYLYLHTLAPTVTFFDSGEFITATACLGSAHSPGYPLFLLYAKPFTWFPFGNIAFRVNFATALSAAMACYGVFLLVTHLLRNEHFNTDEKTASYYIRLCGLVAALTFAFTPRLWLQSNHDKPYPLISFLAAMIYYLILLWRDRYLIGDDRPAYVYLGAFLCGLGFGAHQTMILMIPSYAFLILITDWRTIYRIKEMLLVCTFTVLGFAVHLHLPVRAMQTPLLNWGDPKTLSQFLWHFLRKGYPAEKPVRDLSLLLAQVSAFNIPREFTWAGLIILLAGLFLLIRTKRAEILAYLIGIGVFILLVVGYLNTNRDMIFLTEEFFTPLYLLTAVFIGCGFFAIGKMIINVLHDVRLPVSALFTIAGISFLILPVTVCALNYRENDQHRNYIAFDYASNTLRTLPQGTLLFTWGDSGAFPLWYLQGVERMRDDLDLIHTPHLSFLWYLDAFPHIFKDSVLRSMPLESAPSEQVVTAAIAEQINRRPVYIDFSTRYSLAFPDFSQFQRGIVYQLLPTKVLYPPDTAIWSYYSLRGLTGDMFFRDLDTSKAIQIYAMCHLETGQALLQIRREAEAADHFRMALAISPELKPQVDAIMEKAQHR